MTTKRKVIELLQGVLEERISPQDALNEWPSIEDESEESVADAWHSLSHYAADADIREKDPAYAQYQQEELADYLNQFRRQLDEDD